MTEEGPPIRAVNMTGRQNSGKSKSCAEKIRNAPKV